jgi:hypothetical protein
MRPQLGALENGSRSLAPSAAQIMSDRDGSLPVWVRAPKRGHEWAGKGFIRSVSIREPGKIKGVRLFHLASILGFIERCEMESKSDIIDTGK